MPSSNDRAAPPSGGGDASAVRTVGVWRIYRTPPPDSTEYYFNTLTQRTQWVKPTELQSEEEKALPPCPWTEFKTESGQMYYHHNITGESVWSKPKELTEWEEAKAKQMTGKQKAEKERTTAAATDKPKGKEKKKGKKEKSKATSTSSPSTGAAPAPINDEDLIFLTKEDARAAFRQLLLDHDIGLRHKSSWSSEVLPKISNDPRFKALKSNQDKKKVFVSYMEELVKMEAAARRRKEETLLEEFQNLLDETVEIGPRSKFRTILPILQQDERYTNLYQHIKTEKGGAAALTGTGAIAAMSEEAAMTKLESLFYKHVDALAAAEKKAAAVKRETQRAAFAQLLREHTEPQALQTDPTAAADKKVDESTSAMEEGEEEGEIVEEGELPDDEAAESARPPTSITPWINHHTSWRSVRKHSDLTRDPRWKSMPSDEERLGCFDSWLDKLRSLARQRDHIQRERIRKEEKSKKHDFTNMLDRLAKNGHIHARTKFKEAAPFMEKEEAYAQLLVFYTNLEKEKEKEKPKEKEKARDRDRDHDHSSTAITKASVDRIKDLFSDWSVDLIESHEDANRALKALMRQHGIALRTTRSAEDLLASLRSTAAADWPPRALRDMEEYEVLMVLKEMQTKLRAKAQHFHAKQKQQQIPLVHKLLQWIFKQEIEMLAKTAAPADNIDDAERSKAIDGMIQFVIFELAKDRVHQLYEPEHNKDKTNGMTKDSEGDVDISKSDADGDNFTPTATLPPLPSSLRSSLAAWRLLEAPPLPPPDDAPDPSDGVYRTDEYTREAFDSFRKQLAEDARNGKLKPPSSSHKKDESKSSRKRARSASKSPSRSASRSVSRSASRASKRPSASRSSKRSTSRSASRSHARSSSTRKRSLSRSHSRSRSHSHFVEPPTKRPRSQCQSVEDETKPPSDANGMDATDEQVQMSTNADTHPTNIDTATTDSTQQPQSVDANGSDVPAGAVHEKANTESTMSDVEEGEIAD